MTAENENKLDYGAILADLEAKRAVLDQAIASLRAALAAGALGAAEGVSYMNLAGTIVNPPNYGGEIPAGAFLGKNIPDSAKLYLSMVKKKQTSQEIARALREGGMETTSKNFEGMVHSLLNRASKNYGEIVKVGRAWALAEWYPAGIRAAAAQEKRKTRKAKRGRPPKLEKPLPEAKPTVATESNAHKHTQERITEFLRKNPGHAYSRREACDALKIDGRGLHLIFRRLVEKKIAEEVEAGKYRAT